MRTGGTPRSCTSIAKPHQVTSANPQKDKEMISVWGEQWHFAKTTAGKCSFRKENFFPQQASGRYAKPSCNVALAVWTRSSLMNARRGDFRPGVQYRHF